MESIQRTETPQMSGERETLTAFLQFQRDTLAWKCSGLTPDQLRRRAIPPSELSLLGLVRHLTDVERGWFARALAGADAPALYWRPDPAPDTDFDVDDADPEESIRLWHDECDRSRSLVDACDSLDTAAAGRSGYSLRWILVSAPGCLPVRLRPRLRTHAVHVYCPVLHHEPNHLAANGIRRPNPVGLQPGPHRRAHRLRRRHPPGEPAPASPLDGCRPPGVDEARRAPQRGPARPGSPARPRRRLTPNRVESVPQARPVGMVTVKDSMRQADTSETPPANCAISLYRRGFAPRPEAADLRVRSHRHALREWRRALLAGSAWALDTAAHLAAGTLAYPALYTAPATRNAALAAAVTTWLLLSFLHRVVIQHSTRATAAKTLLGLHLENPGRQPITYWHLVELWFAPLAFARLLSF